MNQIVYQANVFITSLKMGLSLNGENKLLDKIKELQENNQNFQYFDLTQNYSNNQLQFLESTLKTKLSSLKHALEIAQESVDNYSVSNLIYKLKEYNDYEKSLENVKKSNNELNSVISMFNNFETTKTEFKDKKKIVSNKSSQELIEERNERLAILNKLYDNKKLSDTEFEKMVLSVRRVYQREIENQVKNELIESSQPLTLKQRLTKTVKDKVKLAINKLAHVLKLNTKNNEIENANFDCKKYIINQNAEQALSRVQDIIIDKEDTNKPTVQAEIVNINNTILEISKLNNEDVVVPVEIATEILKLKISGAKNDDLKNIYIKEALTFGQPTTQLSSGEIVINSFINHQLESYIDYMRTHHEICYDTAPSGIPVERFKDKRVQQEYDKIIQKFNASKKMIEELEGHKGFLTRKASQYEDNITQAV